MKNLILIFVILFTGVTSKGQKKPKTYYDNRDSSVVKILGKPEVSLMLAENPRYGFSTVNFAVSEEGKVISIHNLLNADDLIFSTAKDAIYKIERNVEN